MPFRIKTIKDADKPRAIVTVEETDAQGDPIPGRVWTEPFDTIKKDWAQLKLRFRKRIKDGDDKAIAATILTNEGNNAGLTAIS